MACRNRVYTANEVVKLLNNTDYESSDSDSEFESSSDESDMTVLIIYSVKVVATTIVMR